MRISRITLGVCLAFAAPTLGWASPTFNAPDDVQAITTIETNLATELNIERVKPLYAHNVVVFDAEAPGFYTSREQFMTAVVRELAPVKSISANIDRMNVLSDGRLACVGFTPRFSMKLRNGSTSNVAIRQLDSLQKIDGKWKIIGSHISYAADPTTGKSVLNPPAEPLPPLAVDGDPFAGPPAPEGSTDAALRAWTLDFALAPDVQTLLTGFGPGNQFVIFDGLSPTPIAGRDATSTYYGALFKNMSSITGSLSYFHSQSDGVFGMEMSVQHLNATLKDGKKWPLVLRQNDCLHYVDGKWYDMMDMNSYVTDMSTGMAVMN